MRKTKQQRTVATPESIKRSQAIADRLDIPFDAETIADDTYFLLDRYYQDICTVLPNATKGYVFHNYLMDRFAAYSVTDKQGQKIIGMSQQLSFFLFDANTLLFIWACIPLTDDERLQIAQLFRDSMNGFTDPDHHQSIRELIWPLAQRHVDILPLANLLTMAMFAYMMCHEIAHHNLQHDQHQQSHKIEFEADQLGFEYYCQVIDHFGTLTTLEIPPNMHSAPLVNFYHLKAAEWVYKINNSGSHPLAKDRIGRLVPLFEQYASAESKELWTGLQVSSVELLDAAKQLG